MKKIFKIFFCLGIFFIGWNLWAASNNNAIQIDLNVVGCNYDGICDPGENIISCPLDCTPIPGSGSTSGSVLPDILIYDIRAEADFTSAIIYWKSNISTKSVLFWGTTPEVKDGTIQSIVFSRDHKAELNNLNSGTQYFFVIEGEDVYGRTFRTNPSYFFTKFPIDTSYPLNPLDARADTKIDGILVSWKNPPDVNFDYVRIMRHEDRFRGDPYWGKLIYEGRAESFLDREVVPGKKYYYVLFARDFFGNFSSGVGVSAIAYKTSTEEIISTIKKEPAVIWSIQKFFVHQYNQQVTLLNQFKPVEIKNNLPTIIDTDLPTHPDDWLGLFSIEGELLGEYLFSFNKDSGRWQSVIPSLTKEGNYWVEIYRYNKKIEPEIISQGLLQVEKSITPEKIEVCKEIYCQIWFWVILILALFFIVYYLLKKRKKLIK